MVKQAEQIKSQVSQQARASSAEANYLSDVARNHTRAAPSKPHGGREKKGSSFHRRGYCDRGGKPPNTKCNKCGKDNKHAQCPAKTAQCRNCQKTFCSRVSLCKGKLTDIAEQDDNQSDGHFLGEVKAYTYISDNNTTPWPVKLKVCETPLSSLSILVQISLGFQKKHITSSDNCPS